MKTALCAKKSESSGNNSCGIKGWDNFRISVKLNTEENASVFITIQQEERAVNTAEWSH